MRAHITAGQRWMHNEKIFRTYIVKFFYFVWSWVWNQPHFTYRSIVNCLGYNYCIFAIQNIVQRFFSFFIFTYSLVLNKIYFLSKIENFVFWETKGLEEPKRFCSIHLLKTSALLKPHFEQKYLPWMLELQPPK